MLYYCNLCIFIVRFMYSYCSTTLTEVFPCFSLSCKANARVKLAKTGHGPHTSQISCYLCRSTVFMLFCCYCVVLFVCAVPLPPGVNPIAVDKYININSFCPSPPSPVAVVGQFQFESR